MANTTVQLRYSTVAGNTPSSLANGEIAINTRDGVFFYSTPTGTVRTFSPSTGPAGLDTEIQFNDAGIVAGSEKLTFNKTTGQLTVNGTVRANLFSDDGTDLYDFSNRAFTTANAAFAAANSGSGQAGAFNQANAAFITANAASYYANLPSYTANSAAIYANGAFTAANLASIQANSAFTYGNATATYANSAFYQANSSFIQANAAFFTGNSAFSAANSAGAYANAAFAAANAATATDVTQNNSITAAFNTVNAAFSTANSKTFTFEQNTAPSTANSSDFWVNYDTGFLYQNFGNSANPVWAEVGPTGTASNSFGTISATALTIIDSNGSISGANAIFTNYVFAANGNVDLYIYSSNAYANANGGFAKANAAFAYANGAFTAANLAFNQANAAFIQANTPSYAANSGSSYANSAFITANAASYFANLPSAIANSAASYANAAFAAANAATATDITQNNSITVALNTANAAFTRANNSLNANTGGSVTGNITIVGNITSNTITASNTVNVTYTPSTTIGAALNISAANTQGGTGYADFLKITNSSGGATNPNKTFRLNSTGSIEIVNSAYGGQLMSISDAGVLSTGQVQISGKKAVNGPAFSAYANATTQTITSGSQQKVLFQSKEFDTDGCFASSRFTPTTEGYYQLNAEVRLDGACGTGEMMIVIYKNGTEYKRGINQSGTQIASGFWAMQVSSVVYANGTTDYFEIYVQQGSGASVTVTAVNNTAITWFNGCMLRGA